LPLHLSADTDLAPLGNIWRVEALGGIVFLVALAYVITKTASYPLTRPIAFGLVWFVLAMIPTSSFPLAEVENDHRMYFPFVGLTLAMSSVCVIGLFRIHDRSSRRAATAALGCMLLLLAAGTRRRNAVWRSEESLWRDVTLKSPGNGRGWMNYGL